MNTWNILRAAGIGAYLMLFLSVTWGLIGTTSLTRGKPSKNASIALHQSLTSVGLVLLAIHLVGLLLDKYMTFRWFDVLIPGTSAFRPIAVAGGIVAMYAMVIILAASWTRRRLPAIIWRASHLAGIVAFTLAMLHGVFAGTDTVRPIMWGLYLATGFTVLFLLLLRAFTIGKDRTRAPQATHRRAVPEIRTGDTWVLGSTP